MIEPGKSTATSSSAPALAGGSSGALPASVLVSWQKPVTIVFLLLFAANMALTFLRLERSSLAAWLEGAFLASAAAAALVSLGQRLPVQNVLMAGVTIYCLSGLILAVASVTGVPFGPFIYSDGLGGKLFETVPWSMPLLWVVLIVNGRGVARLIMRPWRKTNYYGYWVIGLTCLMAVQFDLGLEPLAVRVKQYWLWRPTETIFKYYTAPWVNFLGWIVTAVGILALTLPWLINKQPVKRPTDYHPLIQWWAMNLWILAGNALAGHTLAVGLSLAGCFALTFYAVRGARW